MKETTISASGERAAIGGYLPQFDEFAWLVYLNLINNKLEWIRVADPKAEKLDDILFSTYSELHAYQVKWTIAGANISFANFIELIPLIADSWKGLKANNPSKKVIPHLITNKTISFNDSLKNRGTKLGSFKTFIDEVWVKLKSKHQIDLKWTPIIEKLKEVTKLNDTDFYEFINVFDFQHSYERRRFSVEKKTYSREDSDLIHLTRFLWEQAAGEERNVEFSRGTIIDKIGWRDRFKTVFNHELIVDRQRYQPIQSTIDLLNAKLAEYKNGYLFLQGGPGSGKSTLLNQWSKGLGLNTRIVRYYAFDFVNPSSHLNFYERGNATHLFFDLVFQLKEAGIYKKEILPYKDIVFLKEVFNEQLKALGDDFVSSGQTTIIIIDGLDHVPREYKLTTDSFLRGLPLPISLPDGVFIILGSQSYDLDDIQQEIKKEFRKGERTIQIDPLKKEGVYKYISNIKNSIQLSETQKLQVFEKSQGHPLYLSYLIEKVIESNSIDETIKSFERISGNIETYYQKIWEPIQQEENLIQLLGLMARINGSMNLSFIQEWNIERSVLKSFRENAKVLFNETENSLSFFHNSFKQFLLHHTSLNYLTNKFDIEQDIRYHTQLANYYSKSKVEKSWKQNHHLFQARLFDKFTSEVTPDNLTAQLLDFRPLEEIRQDVKLGIEIARQSKNLNILIRYLFSLAEIERRQFNIDPASLTEEFLKLGKPDLARNYLRAANILRCNTSQAVKASRIFIKFGYSAEGAALFNLAYPDIITDTEITIDNSHRYEEIRDTLKEWICSASYFETIETIFSKIENVNFLESAYSNRFEEKGEDLKLRLIANLCYSLVDQNKWDEVKIVLNKIGTKEPKERKILFELVQYSIQHCLESDDNIHANEYLLILTDHFTKENTQPIGKIFIADLVFKVTKDKKDTLSWIKDIKQPLNIDRDYLLGNDDESIEIFIPLIKLHKLLYLCGERVSITSSVPPTVAGSDEEVLAEFKRMLCLTTQILADGILQTSIFEDITKRVIPIVQFYYKEVNYRNRYWYKIEQAKGEYYDFLILAVSEQGTAKVEAVGEYLFKEFVKNSKYWDTSVQRKIACSLIHHGFNSDKAKLQLERIESSMLENRDIDSRITECVAHANVYIDLGEFETGEKWLKQAIKESIGVGYRKDYQFSSWIEWLKKINIEAPSEATQRIKWFLSHLNHIKETTEGKAYWNASEELLDVTYEYNLNDGLEQSIWQLEHNLVDFRDTITLFIRHFVNRTKNAEELKGIIQLYSRLYLLIAESANYPLLKEILEKGFEVLGKEFFEEYLPLIITSVNIRAHEENRYYLLHAIDEFVLSKGLTVNDYYSDFEVPEETQRDHYTGYSNTLTLENDSESIDESEVLNRVTNFDDFKVILQKEDQINSYFDWSKVIEKISPQLNSLQIEEISNIVRINRRESEFFAKLSNIASELGDNILAENLANKSLELSSASGWIKYYDGGTRINAFTALKRINASVSYDRAFEIFAQDILSGSYVGLYIEQLLNIIPLITENFIKEDIWIEVFGYLQKLMSNSLPIKETPTLCSIEKPILETLIDYLVYLTKSPVLLIKEESLLLLAKLINQENSYGLLQVLNGKVDEYSRMDICMTLRELNSTTLNHFIPIIKDLALSEDYILRENAKQILDELGESIPFPNKITLPSIYNLHLPEPITLDIKKEDDPYFLEINLDNPRDLIKSFESQIEYLSELSGISEYNLICRIHSIMKKIGQENEWTVEYEKNLRSHLKDIYINYTYIRPRVITARKAVNYVVNELIDSGVIDNDETLQNLFAFYDYGVQLFDEIAKPEFIPVIKKKGFESVSDDWLERINESKRLIELPVKYKGNFEVIAEYNQIQNLDWGTPIEEYMYQIATDNIIIEDYFIFESVLNLSADYYSLETDESIVIIMRDHFFPQFKLKSKWIAINPSLAIQLGWEPEPSKLFAWKNSNGELMAESIYWSNGNMEWRPRKDGDVGEGWFVVVSKDALEQIRLMLGNLYIQKKITRSQHKDSKIRKTTTFKSYRLEHD